MALYIPQSILHLARSLYVRPETYGPNYVALASYDPLVVCMYEEGIVQSATVKYDSSDKHLGNPCLHFRNYSINKYHSDYIM